MSSEIMQMETVGQTISSKQESVVLLLEQVAPHPDINQAILSKIERKPTQENIIRPVETLKLYNKGLSVRFMSKKMACKIADEECVSKVVKVAERKMKYIKSNLVKN